MKRLLEVITALTLQDVLLLTGLTIGVAGVAWKVDIATAMIVAGVLLTVAAFKLNDTPETQ